MLVRIYITVYKKQVYVYYITLCKNGDLHVTLHSLAFDFNIFIRNSLSDMRKYIHDMKPKSILMYYCILVCPCLNQLNDNQCVAFPFFSD